jgi:hypothetical protein
MTSIASTTNTSLATNVKFLDDLPKDVKNIIITYASYKIELLGRNRAGSPYVTMFLITDYHPLLGNRTYNHYDSRVIMLIAVNDGPYSVVENRRYVTYFTNYGFRIKFTISEPHKITIELSVDD